MLNFRYHALSLVAVFLALVIGLLLGVAIGDRGLVSSAEHDVRASLRHDVRQAQQERDAALGTVRERTRFERAAYPALVAGRLDGARLALIELGGSSDRMVTLAQNAISGSGAKLVSVSVIREPLRLAELAEASKGTRYERLGDDPSLMHPFGKRLGIQFTSGGDLLTAVRRTLLVQGSGSLDGGISGVVLVRDPDTVKSGDAAATQAFEDGLVRGLRAHDVPVVGIEASDTDPSQIDWFKAHELSSVDDLDDPIGRAALVYALAGQGGSFGVKPTADGGRLPPLL